MRNAYCKNCGWSGTDENLDFDGGCPACGEDSWAIELSPFSADDYKDYDILSAKMRENK